MVAVGPSENGSVKKNRSTMASKEAEIDPVSISIQTIKPMITPIVVNAQVRKKSREIILNHFSSFSFLAEKYVTKLIKNHIMATMSSGRLIIFALIKKLLRIVPNAAANNEIMYTMNFIKNLQICR